jgi:NADPH-dependent 2,4-dienoyl-CoA reductase/sulfur reductase-like enzyme/nitrite reductase/ring-hydroxylating ferredoxin subunit
MSEESKPNFENGFAIADLRDGGMTQGQVDGEDVLLVRRGDEIFAVGAQCTHYHGPLHDGLIVDDTVRCPWHHACFSLRTGEAFRAPALDPVARWRVEKVGDKIFVREKLPDTREFKKPGNRPSSVVIIGGGAAGLAAADMLRREGYDGPLTMISADDSPPYDRPNLSKDFLAGTAQEDWIPLRPPDYYAERRIDLVLGARAELLDVRGKTVQLTNGKRYEYGALLLATGADPIRLPIEGTTDSVHYLRTFADSRAIVAKAASAKHAVVIGASFIGLEVAASLRTRGIAVDVVAPEQQPLERVMGPEVGRFIRKVHEDHGVVLHLGETVSRIDGRKVTTSGGTVIDADFVVIGAGVRPVLDLADRAGLTIDRGVAVNEYLETSSPGIFAAGDIARWPDPHSGDRIRVEHWVVAERQGQVAAKNILGGSEKFDAVPFFWSQHYDVVINYVGHAERWDCIDIDGDLDARDCAVSYKRGGRTLAVATVSRDLQSLQTEAAMESGQLK